jgi:uncharacterized repeat protein (TIGR03803 family)
MSFAKFAQAVVFSFMGLATITTVCPAQAQTETVLYNFTGAPYDTGPASSLTADGFGNFYGTTASEGMGGWGTVFKLSPNRSGGWTETVLYTFTGALDGGNPLYSHVIFDSARNLYGTTERGGAFGDGVVFELSPVGKSWKETVLYSFNGMDSAFPENGVIMDPAGNLYGTTYYGGSAGGGTVFELSRSGGSWTEQTIYSISSVSPYGTSAGVTMDAAGNIFGAGFSTVFELSPNGKGGWKPTVLYTFARSPKAGDFLAGTPALDQAGNVYGTMTGWYPPKRGTVYKLSPEKNGIWSEKTIYTFSPKDSDIEGNAPYGGLVLDAAGNIYGTTIAGGTHTQGTVFELLAPTGNGNYTEKVLWSFNGINGTDGNAPYGGVIRDSAGKLYGTTAYGGTGGGDGQSGYGGVVFEVTP